METCEALWNSTISEPRTKRKLGRYLHPSRITILQASLRRAAPKLEQAEQATGEAKATGQQCDDNKATFQSSPQRLNRNR